MYRFFAFALLVFSILVSCKSSQINHEIRNAGLENDPELEILLSDLKDSLAAEKISYELLGSPATSKHQGTIIIVELHNTKLWETQQEAIGRKIAKKILLASNKTKDYHYIRVTFTDKTKIKFRQMKFKSNSTRNLIFKSSELLARL